MTIVKGEISGTHYQTVLSNGQVQWTADEPISQGGAGSGPSPEELLCSALAACTCITLRMYADRKQWGLQRLEVSVEMKKIRPMTLPILSETSNALGS